MFRQRCTHHCFRSTVARSFRRSFATVSPTIIPQVQPPAPPNPRTLEAKGDGLSFLDKQILRALSVQPQTSLSDIIGHYIDQTGNVLPVTLPYEPMPGPNRRISFEENASTKEIVTIAHCARDGNQHKITLSSGFALNSPALREGETLIVTCAHTLEQVCMYLCSQDVQINMHLMLRFDHHQCFNLRRFLLPTLTNMFSQEPSSVWVWGTPLKSILPQKSSHPFPGPTSS